MPEQKTVGRELVEKSGINVETLLVLLVRNASAELTTFYYYTILRVNLIGLEGEGLKQIAVDVRIEDRTTLRRWFRAFTSSAAGFRTAWSISTTSPPVRPRVCPATRARSTPCSLCF